MLSLGTAWNPAPRASAAAAWALAGLFSIGCVLALIVSWLGYAKRYAPSGWGKGGVELVEITIVREDVDNLACASNVVTDGLHCGYLANRRKVEPARDIESATLRPYNTVKNELFLGAGLWSAPGMRYRLPSVRFTVVCNYHVRGVVRSASLRWTPKGEFQPLKQSLPVGFFSDCEIPK